MKTVEIGDRTIGESNPTFIIAEAGVNHNGKVEMAKDLVDVAKEAGADAVKFQTFKAEKVTSKAAPKAKYQQKTTEVEKSQYEMLKEVQLSEEEHIELLGYCKRKNILFMSTPHAMESIDLLNRLNLPVFKVSSSDLTNLPFLERMASKNKPIILSTGMANLCEVEEAVNTIHSSGEADLILLHCVTNYPADPEDCNLRAMETLKTAFDVPVGFSDHTLGTAVPVAAVALGACVIEKHFTINKSLPGPDHEASLSPKELERMVKEIRSVKRAMGDGVKKPVDTEKEIKEVTRKSIVSVINISKGAKIRKDMVDIKRPETGIRPKHIENIIGKTAKKHIKGDEPINWEDIE